MNQKYRFTEHALEVLNDRGWICVRSNAISVEQLAKENLIEVMQKDLSNKKHQLSSLRFFLDDSKGLCKFWRKFTISCLAFSGIALFLSGVVLSNVLPALPIASLFSTIPVVGLIVEERHKRKLTQELSLQEEGYAVLEKMIMEEGKEQTNVPTTVATVTKEFQEVPTDSNLFVYQDFSHSYDFYQQHRKALTQAYQNGKLDEYCRKRFTEKDSSILTSIVSLGPNPDLLAKGYTYFKQKKY